MFLIFGNDLIITFWSISNFKSRKGKYVDQSGRENELKKSMILGPFFMFRRKVLNSVGKFDEKLLSGADFDFAMRLARNCKGYHVNSNLGYYLDEGKGLSTNSSSLQELERTVVELRYGLNVLDNNLIDNAISNYQIDKIFFNNEFHEVSKFK